MGRCAVCIVPGYFEEQHNVLAVFRSPQPLEVGAIQLCDTAAQRVIHIILAIGMAPDRCEVPIVALLRGSQEQASIIVVLEGVEYCSNWSEAPNAFTNEGCA